jgi:hypothetical protein
MGGSTALLTYWNNEDVLRLILPAAELKLDTSLGIFGLRVLQTSQ